jgi:DNA transformation protein and related proteins
MRREFIAHVSELLAGLDKLQTRPMFGGHGLYSGGKFFGFVLDEVLYLKADAQSRPRFLEAGLKPFVWNKRPSVNYYRAPPEALESPDEALRWAREALRAAIAARPSTPVRRARSRAKPRTRGKRRTGKA